LSRARNVATCQVFHRAPQAAPGHLRRERLVALAAQRRRQLGREPQGDTGDGQEADAGRAEAEREEEAESVVQSETQAQD
jgi:hypothetical protein